MTAKVTDETGDKKVSEEAPRLIPQAVVESFIAQLLACLNQMSVNPQFSVAAKSMMCDLMVNATISGIVPMSFFTPVRGGNDGR